MAYAAAPRQRERGCARWRAMDMQQGLLASERDVDDAQRLGHPLGAARVWIQRESSTTCVQRSIKVRMRSGSPGRFAGHGSGAQSMGPRPPGATHASSRSPSGTPLRSMVFVALSRPVPHAQRTALVPGAMTRTGGHARQQRNNRQGQASISKSEPGSRGARPPTQLRCARKPASQGARCVEHARPATPGRRSASSWGARLACSPCIRAGG